MESTSYKTRRWIFSARLSMSGFRSALIVLGLVFTSTTAVAEGTHRCISFYGVPNAPEGRAQYESVDPCWGGAHVTVAPFTAYPTGALGPGETLTASQALEVPRKIANRHETPLCTQHPLEIYHMNDGTGQHSANVFWESSEHPNTKTLKLGNPHDMTRISKTWMDMSMDVKAQNVKTYYQAGQHGDVNCDVETLNIKCWTHNFPHVTFDTCSCPGGQSHSCQATTLSQWGHPDSSLGPRMEWLLIPVEYTGNGGDCFEELPHQDGQCHTNPGYPPDQMSCTSKVPLVWHWNRKMIVRCPEPSATAQALCSLLALLVLGRAWKGTGAPSHCK